MYTNRRITYWWNRFHKKFVTLDGNSYTDLAAKAAGCAAVCGNLVQAIINCNYCFLYFLWCYELLKKQKKKWLLLRLQLDLRKRAINAN
jgi:hypothetical protein